MSLSESVLCAGLQSSEEFRSAVIGGAEREKSLFNKNVAS